ncbi:MAG TPA: T9SS type A sorting domain-containing protein [Candidatus Kapabacteria bacterium]|nr:T9SS type A sorting domain-containing protein [Candidatus Kapabacteria bacterium]
MKNLEQNQKQVPYKLWLILVIIIGYIIPMKAENPEWVFIPRDPYRQCASSFFEKGEYMYYSCAFTAYKMHKESLKIVYSITNYDCQLKCFEDTNGIIWLIDINGIVTKIKDKDTVQFTSGNSILGKEIFDVKYDEKNNSIWLTTWKGLIRIQNEEWTIFNTKNSGIQTDSLWGLCIDDDSNLIIGTKNKGLIIYNGNTFENYQNDTLDKYIYSIDAVQKDEKGNIWFKYRYNLVKYDGTNWTIFKQSDSTFKFELDEFLVENSYNIWIIARYVYHFDGEKFKKIKMFDGEKDFDYIYSVFKDIKGNMWFGAYSEQGENSGIIIYRKGGVILSAELENNLKQIGYIFPNPSDEYIQLNTEIELGTNFAIINTNGIKVSSGNYNGQINISNLNPGFYTINIKNQNYKFIKK